MSEIKTFRELCFDLQAADGPTRLDMLFKELDTQKDLIRRLFMALDTCNRVFTSYGIGFKEGENPTVFKEASAYLTNNSENLKDNEN